MRLVKRTVNQDDTSAYHLFYADGASSPGSDLTFFDSPLPRERRGTHSIVRTGLCVNGAETLQWWAERLRTEGVLVGEVVLRDGRLTLDFEGPEGQRLMLVDDGSVGEFVPWQQSPVPLEHQIRGLGPVMLSVARHGLTDAVLRMVMGMELQRRYPHPEYPDDTVYVYAMGTGGPAAEVRVSLPSPTSPRRNPVLAAYTTSHSGCQRLPNIRSGRSTSANYVFRTAVLWIATIFAVSISTNQTVSSLNWPPTSRVLPLMSLLMHWANGWHCPPSSNRVGHRLKRD